MIEQHFPNGKKIELIVLQNAVTRDYRLRLFEGLNRIYKTLFIFPMSPSVALPRYFNAIILNKFSTFMKYLSLTMYLMRIDYEVILTTAESRSSLLAWPLAKLRRKKIVFWSEIWYDVKLMDFRLSHEISFSLILAQVKKVLKLFIMKKMFLRTDSFVAIGKKAYDRYLNYVDKTKLFYSPKYVEKPEVRDCGELLKSIVGTGQKKIILYSGRLIRIKGVEYLIRAFLRLEKNFNDVFLLIIGEGELRKELEDLAKSLNIRNIHFQGWLDRTELNYFYKECYVFVQPSIFIGSRGEANGYSIYECMAFGKPIITTDAVGAVPQFVQDGINGFVVKNSDEEALKNALVKLIQDEKLAIEMGRRSKEIYDREISSLGQIEAFKKAIDHALGRH